MTATVQSDNSVYAQLTRLVGPRNVAATAHAVGITRRLNPYFAIGLGADPVSPLEMARAYSTFANNGYRVDGRAFGNRPRAIARVRSASGRIVDDNRPTLHAVLARNDDAILTSILEQVVTSGTGERAALPDRPAAGKTGTTENYGDAWFVGYTPQLATAVWVGYPTRLRPMLTEYHGDPVAGGTFPAEIWRAFMQPALAKSEPEPFPPYRLEYAATKRVTLRDGRLQLDNGYCKETVLIAYFSGRGPGRTANCKPNEVDVPRVVGQTLAQAKAQLAAQPLSATVVFRPARPKQRLGVVIDQFPRSGRLSSFDTVTLVLAKPLHGVVPNVVGLSLARARVKLRAAGLSPRAPENVPKTARVVAQEPRPRVAAAPKLAVTLTVRAG